MLILYIIRKQPTNIDTLLNKERDELLSTNKYKSEKYLIIDMILPGMVSIFLDSF